MVILFGKLPSNQLLESFCIISRVPGIQNEVKENLKLLIRKIERQDIPSMVAVLRNRGLEHELKQNFNEIYNKCSSDELHKFVENVKGNSELENEVANKFVEIILNCPDYLLTSLVKKVKGSLILEDKIKQHFRVIISKCSETPKLIKEIEPIVGTEEIRKHMPEIIKAPRKALIIPLIENINMINGGREILEEYEEQLEPLIIECCTQFSKEKLENEEIYDFVKIILNEVAENENKSILDIKRCGQGQFSQVFQIGEKIVKFGDLRISENIPYHRRILQPIIRRPIYNKKRTAELFYIEISENVLNSKEIFITEDDVYSVYKELREDGLVWTDAKIENLGKLKKPNSVHMKNFNEVDDKTLGIERKNTKKEQLPEGEFVIIDTDCVFKQEKVDFKKIRDNYNCSKYEIRYEQEKKEEKGKYR